MSRVAYESPEDRVEEDKVILLATTAWGKEVRRISPGEYSLDCAVYDKDDDSRIEGWVEIKRRYRDWEGLDTAWINVSKWVAGCRLVELDPEFYFTVIWAYNDEVIQYTWDGQAQFDIKMRGRGNPRDEYDFCPMVLVPRACVRPLS